MDNYVDPSLKGPSYPQANVKPLVARLIARLIARRIAKPIAELVAAVVPPAKLRQHLVIFLHILVTIDLCLGVIELGFSTVFA